MVDFENKPSYDVYDLKKIIALLRAPGGCPWDIEQTHESIRRNLLEEAYEAAEAIDANDSAHLREELGDVLMQVIFHSDIEEKNGSFSLDGVADEACRKLIRRHPHVFGDVLAASSGDVLANWDAIKKEERKQERISDAMRGVARSLPALWRAEKVQGKASKAGCDWISRESAVGAIRDSLSDLNGLSGVKASEACAGDIIGGLLFSAVSLALIFGVDPEEALTGASEGFIERFARAEDEAGAAGRSIEGLADGEREALFRKF